MGCPQCGKLGRRKRIRCRKVRSLCYQREAWLEIHYGEYLANCDCCVTFHSHPPGVDLKAKYDHKVRQAVIDGILIDKLNLSTIQQSMQRDFLLKLSTGYIYSTLEYAIRQFDGNDFRQRVLAQFSGTLCIDEIHLGRRVVLLASDPVSDIPVGCALVSRNDGVHMRRFMQNLKNRGLEPKTVISDRSPLYPQAIENAWPTARHQLCIFHTIADINKFIIGAVRQCGRSLKPKFRKKRRVGKPTRRQQARRRKEKERKRKADLLFRKRYLIVSKRSKLVSAEKTVLEQVLAIDPVVKTLRRFADDIHALFSLRRSKKQAWKIWRRMRRTRKYLDNPALKKALKMLSKQKMEKLLVYLDQPTEKRKKVRTNNHVERCNRKIRYLEKVRYKWRRQRTIIRHILLQFQYWLKQSETTTKRQPAEI